MMLRNPCHRTQLLGCLALVVAGCGGAEANEPPAQPQITSAPISTQPDANTRIARLAGERDRAQEEAKTLHAQLADERERNEQRMQGVKARDEFEDATWTRFDRIDARTEALKTQIAKASPARRAKVDKILREVATKLDAVEKDVRHVRTIPPASWDTFTRDVETAVIAIEQDLDRAEAQR